MPGKVEGAVQQWQRVSVDFTGPNLSETASTFTDYRLDVTFRHSSGATMVVPGFFAADGNAEDSNASSGNVWRVHFNPPKSGEWTYTASFRTGDGVAAKLDPNAGTPTAFHGTSGTLNVAAASTNPADGAFRTEGMVVQDGNYLVHKGTGDLFIKAGADSPENLLGYTGFDGTSRAGAPLHSYSSHLGDWKAGDPTWDGGKGKEIIGAVNYLASKGLNDQYFLTMNVGGDGKDVWPWVSDRAGDRLTFDVSKLAQWETLFEHMDDKGMLMHVITQETENDQLLGGLTEERMIYYRELVARFGHHNGVIWNIGEENSNTTAERKAFADYIKAVDPYDHVIDIHNWPGQESTVFGPLTGTASYDGISLQKTTGVRAEVAEWVAASKAAGNPWVVMWDEVGPPGTGIMRDSAPGADANHDKLRGEMWGALTAGAAGIEWYAGGEDQSLENFRNRDDVWTWTSAAKHFFQTYLPAQEMKQADALTSGTNGEDYVIAKPGSVYAAYLPKGGTATLDLRGQSGTYDVDWYDPRHGGALQNGSVTTVNGGGLVNLGSAPNSGGEDWTILVRKTGSAPAPSSPAPAPAPSAPAPAPAPSGGDKMVMGTTGNDALVGGSANEHLVGGTGNDFLNGIGGNDRLEGGTGNDWFVIAEGIDTVVELADQGADVVHSWVSYSLPDNVENLTLRWDRAIDGTGNGINNRIEGNDSSNTLNGLGGYDLLKGRGGADQLIGGAGGDVFDFDRLSDSRGSNIDRIADFTQGQDQISLASIDADSAASGNQAFAFIGGAAFNGKAGELRYAAGPSETNIFVDVNGDKIADMQIQLAGNHALTHSDFIL